MRKNPHDLTADRLHDQLASPNIEIDPPLDRHERHAVNETLRLLREIADGTRRTRRRSGVH